MSEGSALSAATPTDEYTRRLNARKARVNRLGQVDIRLGNLRLLLAAASLLAGWWSAQERAFSVWWLVVPIAAFVAVVLYHHRIQRERARVARAANFYRRGLARLEDRWAGGGQQGERFNDSHHVYAADLDLFGAGSLFELLSTARTRMGEDALAHWLLSPSPPEDIRERHACVTELRPRLDLREELALLGVDSKVGVHPASLLAWAETPNGLEQPWIRWACRLFPILALVAAVISPWWGIAPLLLILTIEAAIWYALKRRSGAILSSTENAFDDLTLLAELLTRLERESFQAAPLRALKARLSSHTLAASRTIARLSTIANLAESRRNVIVALLEIPLLYSVQVALAAERWRRAHGAVVRAWIDAVGKFEALASIATYSYEHPDDPFPELVDGPACFQAAGLGHPLIPAAQCVRNDVDIHGKTKVLLVSGSNMSGKSTLLRAVGVNAVLAMAGAPVRARSLRLTPLQIGASIRINDSLHEGSSRFYAEITRLRQLHDLTPCDRALLFLLDELLQGTNSSDRRTGAEGVVRAFVERGAIGLVSTHDLALTQIGGLEEGSLRNVHFQDELEKGRMKFDFHLRDGVVTKSNGLELMRSIGLNV